MRKSKVLEKLKRNEPVICGKTNLGHPWIVEIFGMIGYDCVWLCAEHCPMSFWDIDNCVRAGKIHDMDILVRVDNSGYANTIKPLELDATGIMHPHCMNAEEAREVVQKTRFMPVGRRPIDGGNIDGMFCSTTPKEYTAAANANKFVSVQIEDKEAIEHIDSIVAVDNIDFIYVGPGDLSHSLGSVGDMGHPEVQKTFEKVAEACKKHGKAWGTSVSKDTVRTYYDMGARFFGFGADVIAMRDYLKAGRDEILAQLPGSPSPTT